MELGINDKRVLVVGASKGIGRACALAFACEGASVIGVARSANQLNLLVEEMKAVSAKRNLFERLYSFETADLLEHDDPGVFADKLIAKYGSFDIVVHAVGGSLIGSREPTAPVEEWEKAWRFNCGIAIAMNHRLIPPMRAQKWGRVIHISSISAETLRGSAPYASAKEYLNAYTKTIGRILAPDNVVVSAVMPGAVVFEGSYWDKFIKEKHPRVEDFLTHHQAAHRFGLPEEIAPFVVILGSELAGFAHGSIVPVDGGNM